MRSLSRVRVALPTVGVALATLIVLAPGCGDGGSDGVPAGPIAPGFFVGPTREREPLSITVGDGIVSVFVVCGGPTVFTRFDPPEPIARDGSFGVTVQERGRTLTVTGRFRDQDRVRGSIAGDPFCDGAFTAQRCPTCVDADGDTVPDVVEPPATPTATAIPTTPTPPPTSTPTASGGTPTGTTASATPTPELTPTPGATAIPACGNGIIDEDEGEECDGTNLGGEDCLSQGFDGGVLRCDPEDCTFDTDGCFSNDPSARRG